LAALGEDSDEVASSLARSRVQGYCHQPRDCALARYLSAILAADPGVEQISVGHSELWVHGPHWWSLKAIFALPKPVRQFVRDFDEDRYPSLVAPERKVVVHAEPWMSRQTELVARMMPGPDR
jgi:hypothetical protein